MWLLFMTNKIYKKCGCNHIKKFDFNRLISFNLSYYESLNILKNREYLFEEVMVNNFYIIVQKYPLRLWKILDFVIFFL